METNKIWALRRQETLRDVVYFASTPLHFPCKFCFFNETRGEGGWKREALVVVVRRRMPLLLNLGAEKTHTHALCLPLVIKAALILSTAERERVYHEFMNPPRPSFISGSSGHFGHSSPPANLHLQRPIASSPIFRKYHAPCDILISIVCKNLRRGYKLGAANKPLHIVVQKRGKFKILSFKNWNWLLLEPTLNFAWFWTTLCRIWSLSSIL